MMLFVMLYLCKLATRYWVGLDNLIGMLYMIVIGTGIHLSIMVLKSHLLLYPLKKFMIIKSKCSKVLVWV